MAKLRAIKAKNLELPGRYGDGDSLYLSVAPGGSKSWVQRIPVDGKRRNLGLGGYPAVSLAEARDRTVANKRAVRQGRNPVSVRKSSSQTAKTTAPTPALGIPTFLEAATIVHALNSANWENGKTRNNWWQRAERYIFPAIGDMPVDRIGRIEILEILTPPWTTKPETARRTRLIIKTVMAWAMAFGHINVNHAGEIIDAALPPMPKVREHFKSLPCPDVWAAIKAVEASISFSATKLAFKFLVLTAARSGEVRGAIWDEIDFDNALSYMLRRVGMPAVVHGFRSTFRDWAAENTDASFAEMALVLAHGVGSSVIQSYARTDLSPIHEASRPAA